MALGVLLLAWVILVWRWQDPFTALYTMWQQHELAQQLDSEFAQQAPLRSTAQGVSLTAKRNAEARQIAAAAARFRHEAKEGQAIGRIVIGRLGLNMILVNGTDEASLQRGPGRDLVTFMPGQGRLVYIAGHRTTYLAPFSQIQTIRRGDWIKLEMPYGTFAYRATGHVIVPAYDVSVLRPRNHELLALQACNPRFFATQRYVVYAHLVAVRPRSGPSVPAHVLAAAAATS